MKKYISAVLITIFILINLSSLMYVYAEEGTAQPVQSENTATEDQKDALSYTCNYDSESNKVTISGTMDHAVFVEHDDSVLEIYAVPFGGSEYDIPNDVNAVPLATADVSLRFTFTFKVSDHLDKYSRYAIFLRSPDGEMTLATEAQYPEVVSDVQSHRKKDGFKGIFYTGNANEVRVNAGCAIVPVYLDKLFTEDSGGYIYQSDKGPLFFAKKYIDELGAAVSSYSVNGAAVYFQLLLSDGSGFGVDEQQDSNYCVPNVFDKDTATLIHSAVEFLTQRYSTDRGGKISGFIVGKAWDRYAEDNFAVFERFEEYISICGFYSVIVANASRSIDPTIEIIIPVSADNFKSDPEYRGINEKSYSTRMIMDAILAYFDRTFSSGMYCTFLIETDEVPFGISNSNIENGVALDYSGYVREMHAGDRKIMSDYLSALSKKYNGVSSEYIFMWTPSKELTGNALAAAYAYSYQALLGDSSVWHFVTMFSSDCENTLADISKLVKYVDTDNSISVLTPLLEYFGKTDWGDVKGVSKAVTVDDRNFYKADTSVELPLHIKGSFSYLDYSKNVLNDGWYAGIGCRKIQTAFDTEHNRALKAELDLSHGFGEIVYDYEYYEDIKYTPYIEIDFKIEGPDPNALYEVIVSVADGYNLIEGSYALSKSQRTSLILDMSETEYSGKVDAIRISVRKLYGNNDIGSLWLYGIKGHSDTNNSRDLADLIEAERNAIRNVKQGNDETQPLIEVAVIIGIVIITGALGFGVFFSFRKEAKSLKKDD